MTPSNIISKHELFTVSPSICRRLGNRVKMAFRSSDRTTGTLLERTTNILETHHEAGDVSINDIAEHFSLSVDEIDKLLLDYVVHRHEYR